MSATVVGTRQSSKLVR